MISVGETGPDLLSSPLRAIILGQEIVFFLLLGETDLAEEADYHENVPSGLYLVVIVQYI